MMNAPSVPLVSRSARKGFVGETAETELGRYDILDTTISQYGSICAGFQPPQDRARKPSGPPEPGRPPASFTPPGPAIWPRVLDHPVLAPDVSAGRLCAPVAAP